MPRLYGVLPALAAGEITVTDAAKQVGCSRRSLRRYAEPFARTSPVRAYLSNLSPHGRGVHSYLSGYLMCGYLSAMRSAMRRANACMVDVGLSPPAVTKMEPSTR